MDHFPPSPTYFTSTTCIPEDRGPHAHTGAEGLRTHAALKLRRRVRTDGVVCLDIGFPGQCASVLTYGPAQLCSLLHPAQ